MSDSFLQAPESPVAPFSSRLLPAGGLPHVWRFFLRGGGSEKRSAWLKHLNYTLARARARTHARTHARARARTHARTHARTVYTLN